MDGRNRPVMTRPATETMIVRNVPRGLKLMVESYQYDRCLQSLSRAVIELLETHPEVDKRVRAMYDQGVEHLEHLEHSGSQTMTNIAERDEPA